jgi:hypothetical protein
LLIIANISTKVFNNQMFIALQRNYFLKKESIALNEEMGFDKSTHSGKNFINTEKAEKVATVDMNNVAGSPIEALKDQKDDIS